jgi:hypothetical protein
MNKVFRSDQHRVGLGYSVRFVMCSNTATECIWYPTMPSGRDARRILKAGVYRRVRDQFYRDVASEMGITIFCVVA